jgi:hypothetical protein
MTLASEEKLLRRWVGQQRPFGRGHTYTPSLRRRILMFVDLARAAGVSERECCKAIGVSPTSVASWRRTEPTTIDSEEPPLTADAAPKALLPVEVTAISEHVGGGVSVVTPRGFRVDGLSLDQAAALLRELDV